MCYPHAAPGLVDSPLALHHPKDALAGETGFDSGAEGATAPETLRQKDRAGYWTLESSPEDGLADGARDSPRAVPESLRLKDSGGVRARRATA